MKYRDESCANLENSLQYERSKLAHKLNEF